MTDVKTPQDEGNSERSAWKETVRQFATYCHVGVMFPVSMALGFLAGYGLDMWLGTTPWLAFVGVLMGVAAAARNLLRVVAREESDDGAG